MKNLKQIEIEHVLDLALKGICDGLTRKECHDLINGYLETVDKKLSSHQVDAYYYKAKKLFRSPRKEDRKRMRNESLRKYENLYKAAVKDRDFRTAKAIQERLDSLRAIDQKIDSEKTINIVFSDAAKAEDE